MSQALEIIQVVELKRIPPQYGRMPVNERDALVAQMVYRREAPPDPPAVDKKA
jgi:hypothetical protein